MWEESSGESKRRAGPVPWVKAHDAKSGDGHGTSHARQMQERRQPMAPCTTLIALPSRRAQQRDSQYIEPLPGKSRVPGAGELSSRRGLEVVWAIIWLRLKRGAAPPPPPHAEHGPSFPLPPSPGLHAGRWPLHARWLSVSSNAVLTPLAGQSGAVAPTCVAIKAQNLSAQKSALSIDDER
ncbi:hypothetical protein GRF29_44g2503870 [Pseudopithomyces chartarum]|uniref:Uncharacterized protein n=1 Tax=Pseudopithomyces chartarum TaxID=1892770 RepID=A0AAN6M3H1_9PLEO|nr:hypothetical protein GRF29_44g2503870 [Pseudopithomyces chartarum]